MDSNMHNKILVFCQTFFSLKTYKMYMFIKISVLFHFKTFSLSKDCFICLSKCRMHHILPDDLTMTFEAQSVSCLYFLRCRFLKHKLTQGSVMSYNVHKKQHHYFRKLFYPSTLSQQLMHSYAQSCFVLFKSNE